MRIMSTTTRRAPAGRSRREEYSESTRAALVASALELFAGSGYAETSLDAVASAARVTKGALYHHFPGGKKALFTAAFNQIEDDVHERLLRQQLAQTESAAWDASRSSLRMFLDICLEPTYRRIVWQEGPHVLGFAAWWECEERHALGLIRAMLQRLMDSGDIERLPLEPLARTISGALAGAATAIGLAADPEQVRADFEQVIARLLYGLRPAGTRPGD